MLAFAPLVADSIAVDPFDRLGAHVVEIAASPVSWIVLGAGVGSTVALSASGADHDVRVAIQERWASKAFGDAMVVAGFGLPILAPLALYGGGLVTGDREVRGAGAAALQSVVVACGAAGVLKAATGRPFPAHGGDPNDPHRLEHPEYAREWSPPQSSVGYAWPSGHAACSFAVAASLSAYWSDSIAVPLVFYPLAAAVSAGMLSGDHHWASDVIMGAGLGQIVGWSIGRAFRREVAGAADAGLVVAPSYVPSGAGVSLSLAY